MHDELRWPLHFAQQIISRNRVILAVTLIAAHRLLLAFYFENTTLKEIAMQRRRLGRTDLDLPILSFGASSLGAEFRGVTLDEVFASIRVALELGLNFIDTSPFYGRGM